MLYVLGEDITVIDLLGEDITVNEVYLYLFIYLIHSLLLFSMC